MSYTTEVHTSITGKYFVRNVSVNAAAYHPKCALLCMELCHALIAASKLQHRLLAEGKATLPWYPSTYAPHDLASRTNDFEAMNPRGNQLVCCLSYILLLRVLGLLFYFHQKA